MREELDNEAEGESELKSMEKVTGVATVSLSFSQPAINRAESNTAATRMNLLIVTSIKIA